MMLAFKRYDVLVHGKEDHTEFAQKDLGQIITLCCHLCLINNALCAVAVAVGNTAKKLRVKCDSLKK